MTEPLLRIDGLRTVFPGAGADVPAVDGVSLQVQRGKTLGIVGESGCGKSMLSLSIMRLVPPPGRIAAGQVVFDGQDVLALPPAGLRSLRGNRIAMIFQEPMTSLNPVFTVGDQIIEAMRAHDRQASNADLRARAAAALDRVRIPAAARRLDDYPHQMSGGMRQRVMIAMALACGPDLLIADEPTTALDVTVQAQILDLLRDLQAADRHGHHPDHSRPGRGGGDGGRGRGHVRRPRGRARQRHRHLRRPAAPLYAGPAGQHPRVEETRDRLLAIEGAVPAPFALPPGCRFNPRCVFRAPRCTEVDPPLLPLGPAHEAACIRAPVEELAA